MLTYFEKLQYSLIFMLHKSRIYRVGRGYLYRANLVIAIGLSVMASFTWLMLNRFKLSGPVVALAFGILCVIIFGLLEINVTKAKMLKHRNTYLSRRRYILPFYIVLGLWMSVFAYFYFLYK